jgi:hypothetical protein
VLLIRGLNLFPAIFTKDRIRKCHFKLLLTGSSPATAVVKFVR